MLSFGAMQQRRPPLQKPAAKPTAKWEEYLRRGVVTVGSAVEGLIDRAEKFKSNIKSQSSEVQPVLSLEGQISIAKLKEAINYAAERLVSPVIPGLVDKTALEISDGRAIFVQKFQEKGASVAMHADMGGGAGMHEKPAGGASSVRSIASKLPFEDGFFDHVIGFYSNQYQGDLLKAVREFSRVLTVSGEGVIIDFHPFGMYAKKGSVKLKPAESTVSGIEDYYKVCKAASLRIVSIRESFFDEVVRPLFASSDDERSSFRMVKDSPLLIYLFVKKAP